MKKILSILFFTVLFCHLTLAQSVETAPFPSSKEQQKISRWRFGGGIGGGANNNSFELNISPQLGYAITENLESGISLGYMYSKYDGNKTNLFSVGMYTDYSIISELLLRIHFESFIGKQKYNGDSKHFQERALWIGGGYQTRGRVSFVAGIMCNVLYKEGNSIFASAFRPFGGASISF